MCSKKRLPSVPPPKIAASPEVPAIGVPQNLSGPPGCRRLLEAPTAILTVHSDKRTLKLRTADYKSLLLIGADDFSCEWRDRPITANFKSSGSGGDLVSLEMR